MNIASSQKPTFIRPRHYPQVEKTAELYVEPVPNYESGLPDRPAYLTDTVVISDPKVNRLRQKVFRYISALPDRPAFEEPSPTPRNITAYVNIPKPPEVRLAKDTVSALLNKQMPDDEDTAWLREYQERLNRGETKENLRQYPPLGRPQRTIPYKDTLPETLEGLERRLGARLNNINEGVVDIQADIAQGALDNEDGFDKIMEAFTRVMEAIADANQPEAQIDFKQVVATARALQLSAQQVSDLYGNIYDANTLRASFPTVPAWLFSVQDVPYGEVSATEGKQEVNNRLQLMNRVGWGGVATDRLTMTPARNPIQNPSTVAWSKTGQPVSLRVLYQQLQRNPTDRFILEFRRIVDGTTAARYEAERQVPLIP